ncbi:MAG: hypothetical protein WC845_01275 [Candidatus Staskawiczbacteria bacterium]|jgi:hypothetical protein
MKKLSIEKLKNLYTTQGKSAQEISRMIGCSEHGINYWLRVYRIKKRTISEAIYLKNNPNGDPFRIKKDLTTDEQNLLGLGLGLYWGEGNKKSKTAVRLGNSDPKLIRTFREFLVKICNVKDEKIKYNLLLFNDADERSAINFWGKELGYSSNRIGSVTSLKPRGKGNYKKKSMTGVLMIEFNNIKLKKEVDAMLDDNMRRVLKLPG